MRYESWSQADFVVGGWKQDDSGHLSKTKDFGQGWVFSVEIEEATDPDGYYSYIITLPDRIEFRGEDVFDSIHACKLGAWDAVVGLIDQFCSIKVLKSKEKKEGG